MTSTTNTENTTTREGTAQVLAEGVEFAHLDPRTLIVGANVRTDADLSGEFIGSIKQHGVIQAIRVRREADGSLTVLEGQRRTLAAIEAGRATIPAQIVTSDDDEKAREARRIIEQLAENDHRADMRDTHRTAAFRQLSLEFGLTAGQIAKRTGTKKDQVAVTLKVAESKVAAAVQAKYDLTIDQAAVLAEFADAPETVKALTAVAVKEPGRFAHEAQRARDDRERAEQVAAAREALAAEGVSEVEAPSYDDKKVRSLSELRPSTEADHGTDLTPEAHAECPGHAAYVRSRWSSVSVVYVCTNWRTHGHGDKYASASPTKSGPMTDEQKAERRTVIENNKAWKSAEVVRREWLAEFAKRKTAPKGAAEYVALAIAADSFILRRAGEKGHALATEWLGAKAETGYYATGQHIAALIAKATPSRAQHIALVLALAAREGETGTHTWRNPGHERGYLTALESWGYTLSDVEQIARGEQDKAERPSK
ncbi:ParB/RepB/Spo0J family partition protein [Isoptericola sp. NPDC056134]|uniref:ParB/RepB/Spo0J family partition protein n=1 Tax=Isoptericola sp. NPDC056134 TaxID=3345723 RepID=UPI0035EDD1C5